MYWVEWNTRNARPARKSREESSPRGGGGGGGGGCQRGGAVLGLMLKGGGGYVVEWEGMVIAMSGRGLHHSGEVGGDYVIAVGGGQRLCHSSGYSCGVKQWEGITS